MATEIKTWQIINGELKPINTTLADNGRKEKDDLEKWIKSKPDILGDDILIIGEQIQTQSGGKLDFLGIDYNGYLVIIELKREKLERLVLAQAIDYASDVASYELETLNNICLKYTNRSLEDCLTEKFPDTNFEEITINQEQRILLVGFAIEESLHRMIDWLSEKYSIAINAIILQYSKTKSGDELLSRTVIIPEEVEREKINKKKFVMAMSNGPGTYDNEMLKEKLKEYLSKNTVTCQRLKDYFIPILLKNGIMTRENMKKEFVKVGGAADESQAGYSLSPISIQLGLTRNDFLRQVIEFGSPNFRWEKNNFKIRDEYKELVKEVLDELKP
jgi:hypothetical protein